jgi:hypothetical protein
MQVLKIPFLRVGEFISRNGQKFNFTQQDLNDIAGYNPAVRKAPLVIGHDLPPGQTEDTILNKKELAFGIADRVVQVGNQLVAEFRQYSPKIPQLLAQGAIPGVSVKLWHPKDPYNPNPGKYSLRHVAAVGEPAIAGLGAPEFGEFEATQSAPEHDVQFDTGVPYMTDEEKLAAAEKALADKQAAFEADQAKLARERLEFSAYQDSLSKVSAWAAGDKPKIPPAWVAGLTSLRTRLAVGGSTDEIEFSVGTETHKESPMALLDRFVESLSPAIEFSKDKAPDGSPAPLANPNEVITAARAYQAQQRANGLEFSIDDAILAVTEGK